MTTNLESIIPDNYKNIKVSSYLREFAITNALQSSHSIDDFFENIIASDQALIETFPDDVYDEDEDISILEFLSENSPNIVATILPFATTNDANTEFTSTGQDFNPEFIDNIDESESLSLQKLVESQGFLLSDFQSKSMIENHPFLQEVVDELDNNSSWETSVLTIYGNLPIEYAILLLEQKIVITQATAGFYNPIAGSGSLFNIKINEPLVISKENSLIDFSEDDDQSNAFGYSVFAIYGDPELTITAQPDMPKARTKAIQLTLDVFD